MSDHRPTEYFYNLHDPFNTYEFNLPGQAATLASTSAYNQSNSYTNGMSTSMGFSESLEGSLDYKTLARAFGLSSSSSNLELFSSVANNGGLLNYGKVQQQTVTDDQMVKVLGVDGQGVDRRSTVGGESVLASPGVDHSSISSSGEASGGGDEDCRKEQKIARGSHDDEDGDSSKNQNKQNNKKGEKRQKEPRFAFMSKSEVDHLEDGYRWRKYGQKAVKNSTYPRSYYRCTTQKCNVKKRVERSFQDPSIVITTYEGQHCHPIPTTLRGSYNLPGLMFSPPSSQSPAVFNNLRGQGGSFISPRDLLFRLPHQLNNTLGRGSTMGCSNDRVSPDLALSSRHQQLQQRREQPLVQVDYGLLQDMVNVNQSAPYGHHKQVQP